MSDQLEIEATDVIKVILQFLQENSLPAAAAALADETRVALNAVPSVDAFCADVLAGRWGAVLPALAPLRLPPAVLEDLYEHVALELCEAREGDAARALLRQSAVAGRLRAADAARAARLDALAARAGAGAPAGGAPGPDELYGGAPRERRRAALAAALAAELSAPPPSRLMALLSQALAYQRERGLLPPGGAFDLLAGGAAPARDAADAPPGALDRAVRFGAGNHPEALAFSPDGLSLATGSADGFVEIWDPATGRLRKDLPYQAEERFMMHDAAVLAAGFSADGALLATGCGAGVLKVWRLASGQCLRRFDAAHGGGGGVAAAAFSADGSLVLTAGFDGLARVHGVKSGRLLREFRGHASYVNAAVFLPPDGGRVATGSSDGSVRLWDARTCECVAALRPPARAPGVDTPVLGLAPVPPGGGAAAGAAPGEERLLVVVRAPAAYLMTTAGRVVRAYSVAAGRAGGGDAGGGNAGGAGGDGDGAPPPGGGAAAPDFVAAALSPRGDYVLALAEDGQLHAFDAATGRLERSLAAADKGPIAVAHHPLRNLVATAAEDGALKLWKPA